LRDKSAETGETKQTTRRVGVDELDEVVGGGICELGGDHVGDGRGGLVGDAVECSKLVEGR
jgi:hypothetical protein